MARTGDEGFAELAHERWPELEVVALAATLSPVAARELTTRAVAELRSGWPETMDRGTPTADGRRALLAEVSAWERRREAPSPAGADPQVHAVAAEDERARAGLTALADEPPMVRAALAAEAVWVVPADEVEQLAGRPGTGLAALTDRARQRVERGLRPVPGGDVDPPGVDGRVSGFGRRDDELGDLFELLATTLPVPPEPGEIDSLTTRARRHVVRRVVLTGGAAVVGMGAVAWGLGRRPPERAAPAPSVAPASSRWRSWDEWPARGALADDPGIAAMVTSRFGADARLLWADDVDGQRVVVGALPSIDGGFTGHLLVWTGPARAEVGALTGVDVSSMLGFGAGDVVAVVVPRGPGGLVVVLGRPTDGSASLSRVVRLTRAGTVERDWTTIAMTEGVGTLTLASSLWYVARVRCGTYEGPIGLPTRWDTVPRGGTPAEGAAQFVHLATDLSMGRLTTRDHRTRVTGVPTARSAESTGPGTVHDILVTTPDGAVVRTILVTDRAGDVVNGTSPQAVRPGAVEDPLVLRLDPALDIEGSFLVTVPSGAATVRLHDPTDGRSVTPRVRVRGRATVVAAPVPENVLVPVWRVVVRDDRGRTLYDDVPRAGTNLIDIGPVFG